eukprot:184223-Chlamydomonas_euryale.AAC.2
MPSMGVPPSHVLPPRRRRGRCRRRRISQRLDNHAWNLRKSRRRPDSWERSRDRSGLPGGRGGFSP